MIERAHQLTDQALEAIADLERRVLAADGGRLKLEWGTLRNRGVDTVSDLLWWEGGALLGFLGIYGYGGAPLEVTGMVDPLQRRRGIAMRLWTASLPLYHARGATRVLLVVPRASAAGAGFATAIGASQDHSEHALRLETRPPDRAPGPSVSLRPASRADIATLSHLYDDGFHDGGHVDESRLFSGRSRTLLITHGGETVGTLALSSDGLRGAIHGFVVDSRVRGQGIGRCALQLACRSLFEEGVSHVELEVASNNDRALGLYTSVGFVRLATDDYYGLDLTPPAEAPLHAGS